MSQDDPRPDSRVDRRAQRHDAATWSNQSTNGVVACAHYLAAEAGAQVLAAGGNAADAAVATAFALNVCEPAASGLGGMAMAIVHGMGATSPIFLEGACTAPAAATPERIRAAHRYRGYQAIAVPGAPAVWSELHTRFGRLPLHEVVRPAVALARQGCATTALQHQLAGSYQKALLAGNASQLALDADGTPRAIGSVVKQPVLADTIEQLGKKGLMDFYVGDIAAAIADDMRRNGGFVAADDLAARRASELPTITTRFAGGEIHTSGPPAGGLALAQLCTMVEVLGRIPDPNDPNDLLLCAEMIQRVRQDRRDFSRDIGSTSLGAASALLTEERARTSLADIHAAMEGPGETSHLCTMDADGGTVSMTVSIERSFGSARMGSQLGFLYNGYLRGFKIESRQHPHFLRPGALARSNAAPTIHLGDDGKVTAIGATGSERMVSSIFTTLLRLQRQSAFESVAGPRIHCTPEGLVLAESNRLPGGCRDRLASQFSVSDQDDYAFKFGGLQLAIRDGNRMTGVGEPRRDGGAAAPGSR